jgi:hypothetical protein
MSDTDTQLATTNNEDERKQGVPKTWRPEYDKVLYLRVLGWSQSQVADALGYSKTHVQRICSMPEFKALEKDVREGDGGLMVDRARAALTTLLPAAVGTYRDVMEKDEAHDRDKLTAASAVADRFIPKQRRDQYEGGAPITINIATTRDDYMRVPEMESAYLIICPNCGEHYEPNDDHQCARQLEGAQPYQLP